MNDQYSPKSNSQYLSDRFKRAFSYAYDLHQSQTRKGTDVPYFSHLMAVTALVCEDGGDEELAIAAILHDTVEDHGGYETLSEIREMFGNRVADIVEACSDSFTFPKPHWEKRKRNYLDHLKDASSDVRRVSLADKLHNARSIVRDLELHGDSVWERFNGGKEGTIWYYRSLAEIFSVENDGYMAVEFKKLVDEIIRQSKHK